MVRKEIRSLLFGSLFALSLGLSVPARAQDREAVPPQFSMDQRVVLDFKEVDLYDALKTLFKQVKIDFTLDNSLKGTLITAKINQPFKVALESLIKASGLPITYSYEDSVMRIIPNGDAPFPVLKPRSVMESLNKPLTLQVENISLAEALKLLFNQINIPYSFAAQDAAEMIKVDLKGSGRQVLETLLKSAKTPLTYRAENNTLIIEKRKGVSKEEEKANAPALLQLDFASAKAVAAELGKMTAFKGIDVQPLEQDNALTVTNASTRQLEILQDTVKLLDIQPISLIIKAELIVELKGEGDKKIQTVLATTGITFSGKEVTLDLSTQSNSSVVTGSGELLQSKGTTLNQGVCRIVVMPRLNKDGLITLTSDGNIQLEIIVKGYVQPLKFERRFNSADRVRSGDTNTTLSSIVKVKGEKDTIDANIILVLTATRKPQLSKPPQNGGK